MTRPVACVVGWPVKHSRSPAIHKFWLNELGIDGDYVIQPVEPEKAAAFFAGLATSGYVGCNVTVPHKEAAFAAATRRDPAAEATGALNTLWLEDGKLVGANTDPVGFLANLDETTPGWDRTPGPAVVLGAGGAARAIVWALITRGFGPVHVVNRDPARPQALARQLGDSVKPARWPDVPSLLIGARVLVNTTTLGMDGQPPLEDRPRAAAERRRRQRHRLRAARNRTPRRGKGAETPRRRRPRHAAPPGGAGLRALVRQAAEGDAALRAAVERTIAEG